MQTDIEYNTTTLRQRKALEEVQCRKSFFEGLCEDRHCPVELSNVLREYLAKCDLEQLEEFEKMAV